MSRQPYTRVFKDESKLDIHFIPLRLPHRELQLTFLSDLFRVAIERPGELSQRVLISGNIGTGKTVLSQRFGMNLVKQARERGVNLNYVHINCRECKGSLFIILQRTIRNFNPHFPQHGYSVEELLHLLMQVLDEQDASLVLAVDELEALIRSSGSDPVYSLTRVQETYLNASHRLSLIFILRELNSLDVLDPSTRSPLHHNIIHLEEYSIPHLRDILGSRVVLAFRNGVVSEHTVDFIAQSAASEGGDARYAIELLWRAGKYAEASASLEVLPEHVRKAATSLSPVFREDLISSLRLHEKLLLLGVARYFKTTPASHMSMGQAEVAYSVVCKENNKKQLGHTQLWKYVKELSALGLINTELSGVGYRGKTTLISLPNVSASELERKLSSSQFTD